MPRIIQVNTAVIKYKTGTELKIVFVVVVEFSLFCFKYLSIIFQTDVKGNLYVGIWFNNIS